MKRFWGGSWEIAPLQCCVIYVAYEFFLNGFSFLFDFFIKRCVTHIFFLLLTANMQLSKFFSIMSRLENRGEWAGSFSVQIKKAWEKFPEYALPRGSGCAREPLKASVRLPDMAKNQHVLVYGTCFICICLLLLFVITSFVITSTSEMFAMNYILSCFLIALLRTRQCTTLLNRASYFNHIALCFAFLLKALDFSLSF